MDFRRIPFQFSTTDPAKRHEELQKRFGLPTKKNIMHLDLMNPATMNVGSDEEMNSVPNSPRAQHHIPIFMQRSEVPVKCPIDNSNLARKPTVRIVPIEVEGADTVSKRHRPHSGSSENAEIPAAEWSKYSPAMTNKKQASRPLVCNIPIKVEPHIPSLKTKLTQSNQERQSLSPKAKPAESNHKKNGCSSSKEKEQEVKKQEPEPEPVVSQPAQPAHSQPDLGITLKKIEAILVKLQGYQEEVLKFVGTPKSKQYKYLDEMLTRCMLDLDDVETMGNKNVRLSRKAAVKAVQASIDLLEARVNRSIVQRPEVSSVHDTDAEMKGLAQEGTNTDEVIEDMSSAAAGEPIDSKNGEPQTSMDVETKQICEKTVSEENEVDMRSTSPAKCVNQASDRAPTEAITVPTSESIPDTVKDTIIVDSKGSCENITKGVEQKPETGTPVTSLGSDCAEVEITSSQDMLCEGKGQLIETGRYDCSAVDTKHSGLDLNVIEQNSSS